MTHRPILIGIGGKLASGKDTVADYLVAEYGFIKMGMSEPLNDALLALNPLIPTNLMGADMFERYQTVHARLGYTAAKENPEVRRLLQALGTEVGRDMIDPEVWTKIAAHKIREQLAEGHSVILTGIRFENERDMITRVGGSLVWVDRPDLTTSEGAEQHASENTLGAKDFTLTIENSGTIQHLETKAGLLIETLRMLDPRAYSYSGQTFPPYDH